MKAFLGALLLMFSLGAFASEGKIKYSEGAYYFTMLNGAKVLCLKRRVPDGEATPYGWLPVTCSPVHKDMGWHECWVHPTSGSFLCGVRPS